MPELPEVEVIAQGLAASLAGRRIVRVQVLDRMALEQPEQEFRRLIQGRRVAAVRRRAKLVLLDLDSGPKSLRSRTILAVHLRMTGRLLALAQGQPIPDERHARVVLELADGGRLVFLDVRRFGRCLAFGPGRIEEWGFYASLGPEPLGLDADGFAARLAQSPGRIKPLLLDQTVIAGIGNIYADESLFRAGIRPQARASTLSRARLRRLHQSLVQVLVEAIAANGSSIRDYRDSLGQAGSFQKSFRVYGRAGLPCPNCGKKLKKSTLSGRTTTFCNTCQT